MSRRRGLVRIGGGLIVVPMLAVWLASAGLAQQPRNLLEPGDAAVTGFSGVLPPVQIAPGINPAEKTFIDLAGPSLRLFDLQDLHGPASAQLVQTLKTYTATAAQIGQVFGVALDSDDPPNIYVAASSAYGLPIVAAGADGQPAHIPRGQPGARFMPGLWGALSPDGGPGSIWKIDGRTGTPSLFATVTTDGRQNSGAALGGLAFDPRSRSLYVADRETGLIHRFDQNGRDLGRFDHGVDGRTALSLSPVTFDPARRLDIESPSFDSGDAGTWMLAPPERLTDGLAVAGRRLYYAVAADQQIWSVGLGLDGAFQTDPRIEIVVPPAAGATEISKIAFDEQGRMLLAERPAPTGAFDFQSLTQAGIGRVLRYQRLAPEPGAGRWRPLPAEYAIGFPLTLRNADGGVDVSYLYDERGHIDHASCGGFVWATGEDLRASADPTLEARLRDWGAEHVQGLQGAQGWRIRPDNAPPLHAYFTDMNNHFDDAAAHGHMGDVAIWRQCGLVEGFDTDFDGGPLQPGFSVPAGGPGVPPRPLPPRLCTLLGACPPAPPGCKGPACPPPPCQPDERRGRDGKCEPIGCPAPSALIGGRCCAPATLATPGCSWCESGQVSVGPSHACCPSGHVYRGANGVPACCAGPVVNGQCQPGTPSNPGLPQCQPGQTSPCCGPNYVATGTICCLAGQATANGVCCPVGEIPAGNQCQPVHFVPPGPSCCAAGQTQTMTGQCCPTANITTQGICCPMPVDPQRPGSCPINIQAVPACKPGYTRMPDKQCCLTSHVSHDGKTCERLMPVLPPPPPPPPPTGRRPPIACSNEGSRSVRNPHDPYSCLRCGSGMIANDAATACIKPPRKPPPTHRPPPIRRPRPVHCEARGPRYIANPRNPAVCLRCPPGMVANAGASACMHLGPAPRQWEPPPGGGPPVWDGPPPRWNGPRGGGFGPPPSRFQPGPFRPGGIGAVPGRF